MQRGRVAKSRPDETSCSSAITLKPLKGFDAWPRAFTFKDKYEHQ